MTNDWSILQDQVATHKSSADIGVSVASPDGEHWNYQGNKAFPSASTVKIPIMVEIYRMLDQSELSLDDLHVLQASEKSNGSGVLRHMHSGLTLKLSDLLYLMIAISDNTATNILTNKASVTRINATMRDLGMRDSSLGRPMVGRLAIPGEEENLATANDYVHVIEAIIDGHAASVKACEAMRATLQLQHNQHRIGRHVPRENDFFWGSKIGTNPGIVHDVGFITAPQGTLRIAVFCRGVATEVMGEQIVSDIALAAMRATGMLRTTPP